MEKRLRELDKCIDVIIGSYCRECIALGSFGCSLYDMQFDISVKDSYVLSDAAVILEENVKNSLKILGINDVSVKNCALSLKDMSAGNIGNKLGLMIVIIFDLMYADGECVRVGYEKRVF